MVLNVYGDKRFGQSSGTALVGTCASWKDGHWPETACQLEPFCVEFAPMGSLWELPSSSHSPKTLHVRLMGDPKLAVGVNVSYLSLC